MSSYIILSDFDGTIILEDSALYLLNQFGVGNWQKYDDQLIRGEISLEECLSKQFSSISIPRETILSTLDTVISFRPNFINFVSFCKESNIPLIIVSAGIDFVIKHYMNKVAESDQISIVSGLSKFTKKGLIFNFPELKSKESQNFKEDLVIDYQKQGFKIIYLGDGSGDFYAAKKADISYVVKDSELARIFEEKQLNCNTFLDFQSIIQDLIILFKYPT